MQEREGGRGGPTVKGTEVNTLGWSGGLKDWLMSGRAEEKAVTGRWLQSFYIEKGLTSYLLVLFCSFVLCSLYVIQTHR